MAKMRPILPASARVQRVTGSQHAADQNEEGEDGALAVDLDANSSENDDASESTVVAGGSGLARRKLLWPDGLLNAMLRMRFTDPDISSAIESATSNGQKAAAWRQFAAVLSEMANTRVTERQLRLKFAKIKWEYKRWYETEHTEEERRAMGRPPSYMPILRRWFGATQRHRVEGRATTTTTVTPRPHQASDAASNTASAAPVPTQLEEALRDRIRRHQPSAEPREQADETPPAQHGLRPEPQVPFVSTVEPPGEAGGVTLLAQEAGRGMAAIADALKSRSTDSEVAALLQAHHAEQMAMMRALLDAQRAQTELLERIAASLASK